MRNVDGEKLRVEARPRASGEYRHVFRITFDKMNVPVKASVRRYRVRIQDNRGGSAVVWRRSAMSSAEKRGRGRRARIETSADAQARRFNGRI